MSKTRIITSVVLRWYHVFPVNCRACGKEITEEQINQESAISRSTSPAIKTHYYHSKCAIRVGLVEPLEIASAMEIANAMRRIGK